SPETVEQVRTGMVDVVNGAGGTAHQASLGNVEVAGKTGTAQWGPKHKERTAAWFAGFLPADQPRYAFAAVYEGDVGSKVHGGSAAARRRFTFCVAATTSSMVPLNFGGSSSMPKLSEQSSSIFAISSDVSAAVSGAFANSTSCSSS